MKRGQFYLVTSIVIISIIVGFATLANSVEKRSSLKFYYDGEELKLESEKVLDYVISNDLNDVQANQVFDNFINNYTLYSEADNFYFFFGDNSELEFRGYHKNIDGTVSIQTGSEQPQVQINREVKVSRTMANPGSSVNITLPFEVGQNLKYEFLINPEGKDFYYVISKEIGGDRYIETNA